MYSFAAVRAQRASGRGAASHIYPHRIHHSAVLLHPYSASAPPKIQYTLAREEHCRTYCPQHEESGERPEIPP
jgi:hypothetical protein